MGVFPRFPLKRAFQGDIDMCIASDIDVDIDTGGYRHMAVPLNWGEALFKGSYRASLKGVEVDIRQD